MDVTLGTTVLQKRACSFGKSSHTWGFNVTESRFIITNTSDLTVMACVRVCRLYFMCECVRVWKTDKARETVWRSERAHTYFINSASISLHCFLMIIHHMKALCEFPLLSSCTHFFQPFFLPYSLYSLTPQLFHLSLIHHIRQPCLHLTVSTVELL